MNLKDLFVYQLSMDISEKIWNRVNTWGHFEKFSIGSQLVRAADSISSNIAEGYGRYSFRENKLFCYYSRGSLFETMVWLRKSYNRKLISKEEYKELINDLKNLSVKLNNYIKSLGAVTH